MNIIKQFCEKRRIGYTLESVYDQEPVGEILQTDLNFPIEIRKFGCFLVSVIYVLCKAKNIRFSRKIILDAYEKGIAGGYIKNKTKFGQEDCYVNNLWWLYDLLGKGNYKQYKFISNVKVNCPFGWQEILLYKWNKLGHFVVGNGKGSIEYDPMGNGSPVVRNGILSSKRFIKF